MELICLRTTRAGSFTVISIWLSSLGKTQFIHLRAREEIIELNFLQVQIKKEIKLNSMSDRNIKESCSTFVCLSLSLWLSTWWETCYLWTWDLHYLCSEPTVCLLLPSKMFPKERFQTWCFFTDYLTALKNHHFLQRGLKLKIAKTS